jgi:DNA-binding NtrC family response regulator
MDSANGVGMIRENQHMQNGNIESDDRGKYVGVEAQSTPEELPPDVILVVDDEEAICECLGEMFRSVGHPTVTYTDPIAALEYYRKFYVNTALVILDVVMPKMSGDDVLVAMQSINPEVTVVMISGLCSEDVAAKCLYLGVREFLRKPFTLEEMILIADRYVPAGGSGADGLSIPGLRKS